MEMYDAMRSRYGPQDWWPAANRGTGDGALEICIGAILAQNTNWKNVEKAIANLHQAGCVSVSAIGQMSHSELAELIRPAGHYNVKAKRLKNFIARVAETFDDDIEAFLDRPVAALREELLAINGIGRETADSMILYAAGNCTFVVDGYTYRILLRHGLIDAASDYEQIKELLESALPEDLDLWNDYHAQLVAVGKNHCRPRARCEGCPLEQFPHDVDAGSDGS